MKGKRGSVLGIVGAILMIGVIIICIPFTVPKIFGYEIYQVLTESMEPEYPKNSVVYIKHISSDEIQVGDVITFRTGSDTNLTMTHRVVAVDSEKEQFVTKGDANEAEDASTVSYEQVIGKPVACLKGMGTVSNLIHSTAGILFLAIIFVCAFICFYLDGLKRKTTETETSYQVSQDAQKPVKKQEKRTGKIWMAAGLLCVAVGMCLIVWVFYSYFTAEKEYDDLKEACVNTDSTSVDDWKTVEIDFDALKEKNSDVVGWIIFDNMELSYPILQGTDNETYLYKNIEKTESKAGSIFLEAENSADFLDAHTILYGHNMKDLSMFGKLKKYKTEDFYQEHRYFTVYTPNTVYRYEIFSCREVPADSTVYTVGYGHDEVFERFVEDMVLNSCYDTGVDVAKEDRVITLSTCSTSGNRFVVHAKCVDEL